MVKEIRFVSVLLLIRLPLTGQELEPRLYAALPKNMNAIAIAYGLSHGNVLTDPSLPIANFTITAHNASAVYAHTFALAKKLARAQLTLPFLHMIGQAQINGRDTSAIRTGFGDARLRFSINLLGTPAYDKREFTSYTQKTVLGVSFVTSVPVGLYYEDKRVNIGSNRWAFKPEVGISKRIKRIYAEAFSGVWFFTANRKYLESNTLIQHPVFSIQGHVSYYFKNLMGLSVSGTWFNGGKTLINSIPTGDLLDSWRLGGMWTIPLKRGHSFKLQFHTGAFTNRGYDYDIVLLVYQYVFF
jgi:hypothetical protein